MDNEANKRGERKRKGKGQIAKRGQRKENVEERSGRGRGKGKTGRKKGQTERRACDWRSAREG